MGIIRGGFLVLFSILLFLSFMVGNTLLTLEFSLKYENVQPQLTSIVKNISGPDINVEEKIKEYLNELEPYCMNNTEYVFSVEGNSFTIPCDIINQKENDSLIDRGFNEAVKQIYYKEYNCSFWDCLGESEIPLFLISAKAQRYWQEKFYISVALSFVLFVLVFLLTVRKYNAFFIAGIFLTVSSFPFWKLNQLFSKILSGEIAQFVGIFISKSQAVFLICFIFGIVLLILGGLMKAFRIGMKIYEVTSKEEKQQSVKPEQKEEKQTSKKQKK